MCLSYIRDVASSAGSENVIRANERKRLQNTGFYEYEEIDVGI